MRPNPILLNITAFLHGLGKKQLTPHEFHHLNNVLQNLFGGTSRNVIFLDPPTEARMPKTFQAKQFAAISLNKSDEKKFQQWVADANMSAISIAESFLAEGYKLSVAWVIGSTAFCLSVIGTEDCRNNKDTIMTSWSDDLNEAFAIAGYKHFVLCEQGEWPTADSGTRWG